MLRRRSSRENKPWRFSYTLGLDGVSAFLRGKSARSRSTRCRPILRAAKALAERESIELAPQFIDFICLVRGTSGAHPNIYPNKPRERLRFSANISAR